MKIGNFISWKEPLGEGDCPYVIRWKLNLYLFSIRIHHFVRSDDKRAFHDHPFSFITLVLKGHYWDNNQTGAELMDAGTIKYRPSHYRHSVVVPEGGVWTLLLTGREKRDWGFYLRGKYYPVKRYFFRFGHPPCYEQ